MNSRSLMRITSFLMLALAGVLSIEATFRLAARFNAEINQGGAKPLKINFLIFEDEAFQITFPVISKLMSIKKEKVAALGYITALKKLYESLKVLEKSGKSEPEKKIIASQIDNIIHQLRFCAQSHIKIGEKTIIIKKPCLLNDLLTAQPNTKKIYVPCTATCKTKLCDRCTILFEISANLFEKVLKEEPIIKEELFCKTCIAKD